MSKVVRFGDKDKELIKRIEKYKRAKGLKSFVAAVRELCDDALTLKKISK